MKEGQLEQVRSRIMLVRGQKVILDSDLAELYEVETKALNRAVKRNADRFPEDFTFQLTAEEAGNLRCQFGTSNLTSQNVISSHGGRRHLPHAFTEHGAIMAATVLNSRRAVQMSVFVVRAFIQLRAMLTEHRELAAKVAALERRLTTHDHQVIAIIQAIKRLTESPAQRKRKIGFDSGKKTD